MSHCYSEVASSENIAGTMYIACGMIEERRKHGEAKILKTTMVGALARKNTLVVFNTEVA